jgi:hypothetical protein
VWDVGDAISHADELMVGQSTRAEVRMILGEPRYPGPGLVESALVFTYEGAESAGAFMLAGMDGSVAAGLLGERSWMVLVLFDEGGIVSAVCGGRRLEEINWARATCYNRRGSEGAWIAYGRGNARRDLGKIMIGSTTRREVLAMLGAPSHFGNHVTGWTAEFADTGAACLVGSSNGYNAIVFDYCGRSGFTRQRVWQTRIVFDENFIVRKICTGEGREEIERALSAC